MRETTQRSMAGIPSLWPSMRSVKLGTSSEIDDGSARASHADHLAQGAFGIVEVVEGADGEDGVETLALERELFGFALSQPDAIGRPRGGGRPRAASARCPRRRSASRPAASRDRRRRRPPRRAGPVPVRSGRCRRTLLRARRSPPLQTQVKPLPEAKLGPERAVVKLLGDLVVVGGLVLDDQDIVVDRQPRARTPSKPARASDGSYCKAPSALEAAPDVPVGLPVRGRDVFLARGRHGRPPRVE